MIIPKSFTLTSFHFTARKKIFGVMSEKSRKGNREWKLKLTKWDGSDEGNECENRNGHAELARLDSATLHYNLLRQLFRFENFPSTLWFALQKCFHWFLKRKELIISLGLAKSLLCLVPQKARKTFARISTHNFSINKSWKPKKWWRLKLISNHFVHSLFF